MIFPKPLKKGDTVGVIAPSTPASNLDIEKCKQSLVDLGFKVKLGEHVEKINGYLTGKDEERASDFNKMFKDETVDGIICLKGGYGSQRTLDLIDWTIPKEHPKFFMGYSDITALHVALNQKADLVTFHGPMVHSNMAKGMDDYTKQSFLDMMNMSNTITFLNPEERALETMTQGQAEGILIGGNLSLIASTIGTPFEMDSKDKILFIEDIDEAIYRLDRMLIQLKLAGKLDSLRGILVGDFNNCNPERDHSQSLDDLLDDYFKPLNIPIIKNLGSGHCTPMATLPLGAICHMDANKKTIKFIRP